jgi:choline dehydrogenase-like flavoprotein
MKLNTLIILYALILIMILITIIIISTINNILLSTTILPPEADIVIIGGGVAGCILASRWHQSHPDKHIVLLDRGSDYRNDHNVYRLQNALIAAYTTPYSNTVPADFPNVLCSLATMYGGASSHNFGLAVSGSQDFYQNTWCSIFNVSYTYIQSLFTKINDTINITPAPKSLSIVDRIGPILQILFTRGIQPITQGWNVFTNPGPLASNEPITNTILNAFDLNIVDNYNFGIGPCSCGTQQLFIDKVLGVRDSVNRAYLPSGIRYGPQLSIVSQAEVDRISSDRIITLIDGRTITAKERIVLSAGGIYTPYILKKSGFSVLSQGINQIGANLTTHYGCSMVLIVKDVPDFSAGPLAFTSTEHNTRKWQVVVSGSTLTNFDFLRKQGIDVDSLQREHYTFMTFLLWIMDPKTKGSVEVGPQPIINLNLFDNSEDCLSIIDGLRWLGQVYFRLKSPTTQVIFPPEEVFTRDHDEELLAYAKTGVSVTDHYSRTCAYGMVLNENFEIRGYQGIHVVDASAFPHISDGNTQYPTMVLAELASQRIIL